MKALAILLAIVVNIIALCLTQCAKAGTLPCLPSAAAVRVLHPHSHPTYRVIGDRRCWAHRKVSKSAFVMSKREEVVRNRPSKGQDKTQPASSTPAVARADTRKDDACYVISGDGSCDDVRVAGERRTSSIKTVIPESTSVQNASAQHGIADPAAVWPPPPLTVGRLIVHGILRLMQESHRESVW